MHVPTPRGTQPPLPSFTAPWPGVRKHVRTPSHPLGPPPCPPYPATSYPGWAMPPATSPAAPLPNHGPGAGSHHDRLRYHAHLTYPDI